MPDEEHVLPAVLRTAMQAGDLTVRLAEAADVETLAKLMGELGYATRAAEMQMRLEDIAKDPRYRTFVAVKNGRVCGMIGTFAYATYEHNDPGGRILSLVVASDARGLGVGKKLVNAAENDFAQRNIRRVAVLSHLRREDAHKFYESVGYDKTGYRYVKNLAAAAD